MPTLVKNGETLFQPIARGFETVAIGKKYWTQLKIQGQVGILNQWAEWHESVDGKFLRGTWLNFKDNVILDKLA